MQRDPLNKPNIQAIERKTLHSFKRAFQLARSVGNALTFRVALYFRTSSSIRIGKTYYIPFLQADNVLELLIYAVSVHDHGRSSALPVALSEVSQDYISSY